MDSLSASNVDCLRISRLNPYDSSSNEQSDLLSRPANVHEWNGHEIVVGCRADPRTLWIETVFVVTVDGEVIHTQSVLRFRESVRFTFPHMDRLISGSVARDEELFSRGMKYTLTLDGTVVARSAAPIQNWYLGLGVFMLTVTCIGVIAVIALW